jgi:arylsulfatase A-like enzyme
MPDDNRPNLLLICTDQWRADALGFSGHPVVETPHLDRLAYEGVNFTQAYAATPTCVPARATLLTGLSQRHTGFIGYNDQIDWHYDVTLPGLLAAGTAAALAAQQDVASRHLDTDQLRAQLVADGVLLPQEVAAVAA